MSPQMPTLFLLWMVTSCRRSFTQYVTAPQPAPRITNVSAMCSSEGITASIVFDGPFSGKIYSMDYATVHDCIYYSGQQMDNILFSIPVHRCGTRLSRTSRNMVDQMENRVYVQMEQDAQTIADRQFLFVCQLADSKTTEDSNIRRHPIVPSSISNSYAAATESVKSSVQFRKSIHMDPIKSNTVPRVSAFSSDGHLGNWPIPGARPYSPGVSPVASWPRLPLPDPIVPVNKQAPRGPPIALSEGGGGQIFDQYVTTPARIPSVIATTTPRNPFMPMGNPIIPSRAVVKTPVNPFRDLEPVTSTRPPVEMFTSRTVWRGETAAVVPVTRNYGYLMPEDGKTRLSNEQVFFGRGPSTEDAVTEVPAYPWNKPYPGSAAVLDYGKTSANYSSNQITGDTPERHWDRARIFKEEEPKIGVEFRMDGGQQHKATTIDELSTSRLVSTQEYLAPAPELTLEIQQGIGPFAPAVSAPVKIGDNLTLVARAKSQMKGEDDYDMFVHSCFASDGQGNSKIDLIDKNGCVIRSQFVSPLNRTKDPSGMMYYFFRITAFKFPGPDDVYFSCSIDTTPFRNAPEICPLIRRVTRQIAVGEKLRLFDSVKVELSKQIEDQQALSEVSEFASDVCLSKPIFAVVVLLIAVLLLTVVVLAVLAISFYLRISVESYEKPIRSFY